eukprot:TRINITY_DN6487_c0_g1_i3.p1 TRINITY_DN6487_c0_g1~~TRINITY_DN6487_c0_g1_i3.p1  ORF type:complete len:219 (+),score=25.40 TRINITY_DN6487_c0_g1_i3:171-827(+)
MIALIVAGRAVQTNPLQIEPTKWVFDLSDACAIHHLTVFLTGELSLPQGMVCSVYFTWSPEGTSWSYLGYVANDKPSAMFRLTSATGSRKTTSASSDLSHLVNVAMFTQAENSQPLTAHLGISLEPFESIQQQIEIQERSLSTLITPDANADSRSIATKKADACAMLSNFYNYARSFEVAVPVPSGPFGQAVANRLMIPVEVLEKWMKSFERKLKTQD